jgi:pimeloyl-ACP methyl ester carboxylesterase
MRNTLLALLLALPAAATAQTSFQVKITGHGQPMILIPGLASSGETYDSTVARFKDRYECHVLTLAGFAGVPPAAPLTGVSMLERVRDELAAYIRDKKLVKPVIVGLSLGGFMALSVASKYPDLPGKLIIVDAYPSLAAMFRPEVTPALEKSESLMTRRYMSQPGSADSARAQIRSMVTGDADFERIMAWGRASDHASIVDAMVEMYGTDLREDLGSIQSHTLVLTTWIAYKDYIDLSQLKENGRLEYAKLKGADLRMNETSRHFIMYDDPQWFFAQLEGFLQ